MTDVDALRQAVQDGAIALGDFHTLVNNVGSDDRHRLEEVTLDYWNQRVAINQRAAFFAIQAAVPGMRRRGSGAIINLGSTGWQSKTGGYPVYATAKSSVNGLTRGLARELGADRIRINVLTPGWVMTERQIPFGWMRTASATCCATNACRTKCCPKTSPPWRCSWPRIRPAPSLRRSSWSTPAGPERAVLATARLRPWSPQLSGPREDRSTPYTGMAAALSACNMILAPGESSQSLRVMMPK